jgi:23S rRNA C2498 (ribose-2'-O)-methylase RlmM
MILNKTDITRLKKALDKATRLERESQLAAQNIATIIEEITGIEGNIDHFLDDGFGFTPLSDNDTHVSIDWLIEKATNGTDITEKFILDNLCF